jgi:hypothetical protein
MSGEAYCRPNWRNPRIRNPHYHLIAAIVFAGIASSTVASTAKQVTPLPVIAVVGDSLSVGLAAALEQADKGIHIEGYGVVGSGLSNSRLIDWQAEIQRVVETRPSEIVVEIGMNDSGQSPNAAYMAKVKGFLDVIRNNGIPFEMVSVPPTTQPGRNRNILALNSLFEQEAASHGGRFVVLPAFPQSERTPDGIHFTPAGYRALSADVVFGLGIPIVDGD